VTHASKSRTFLWWFCLFAIMILLVLILYRTGAALVHNDRLKSRFQAANPPSPYQLGIPMDEMDLTVYSSYWPNASALPLYYWTRQVEAPVTIRYYSGIPDRGAVPALEIKKGTKIIAIPEKGPLNEIGYGYISYPTYQKGWRYARPFHPAEGELPSSSGRYYYVRIEDLKAVIREVAKPNQPYRVQAQQMRWRFQSFEHRMATSPDQILYRNGAHLSPDLFRDVFDRWNAWLSAAAGVMALLMRMGRGKGFSAGRTPQRKERHRC